jgi:2'-5' RNA ligase
MVTFIQNNSIIILIGETMRTFIAVNLPDELLNKISQITAYFKANLQNNTVKWVERQNLHLTLKFLGDITDQQSDDVKSILKTSFVDYAPFTFSIQGLGMYPNPRNPRVIWLGLTETEALSKINKTLNQVLVKAGIEKDTRPFSPHLTIGRVKPQASKDQVKIIGEFLSQHNVDALGQIYTSEIHFFQSKLTPKGPIYTSLLSVPLNKV